MRLVYYFPSYKKQNLKKTNGTWITLFIILTRTNITRKKQIDPSAKTMYEVYGKQEINEANMTNSEKLVFSCLPTKIKFPALSKRELREFEWIVGLGKYQRVLFAMLCGILRSICFLFLGDSLRLQNLGKYLAKRVVVDKNIFSHCG